MVVLFPIIAFTASIELTLSIIGVLATGALAAASYNSDILDTIKKDVEEIKNKNNIQKQ